MKTFEICFSPTGGTAKAAELLTRGLSDDVARIDLTDARADFSAVDLDGAGLAVIAVPSYGGRVPAVAAQRISALRGGGTPAVLLCVYGNRAYEDTLAELQDVAESAGFRPVAAVAAIAEHSIAHQYASGRPDRADAERLAAFAEKIGEKLGAAEPTGVVVPGNRPYKKTSGVGMVPKPTKQCTDCGLCARECPVQAIDESDVKNVDKTACISCMRCVVRCPHGARKINPLMLSAAGAALKKACSARKECELYV